MAVLRILLGCIVPLAIILFPIIVLLWISGRSSRIGQAEYIMATLGLFFIGLFGPILATVVSTYGLAIGRDPNDFLCATGAGIFIFFGYAITLVGVPIVGIVRYSPKRKLV